MISVTPGGGVKDPADQVTAELPGLVPKRGRGRPRKPDAMTAAQRAQRHREKLKLKLQRNTADRGGADPPSVPYICNVCDKVTRWRPYGVAVWCATCWPRRTDT